MGNDILERERDVAYSLILHVAETLALQGASTIARDNPAKAHELAYLLECIEKHHTRGEA